MTKPARAKLPAKPKAKPPALDTEATTHSKPIESAPPHVADVVSIREPIAAKFRPADPVDEELLYRWRRDQEQAGRKQGWYHGRATTRAAHRLWFRDRLGRLEMLIWERAGLPLGYVRIDSDGSFAFHPHSPVAVPMLAATWALADRYGGRLKATVDLGNRGAVEALEAAGFPAVPASFHVYRHG